MTKPRPRSKRAVSPLRKCQCDICTKWGPLHRRIMAKLGHKDRKLFEEYVLMEWAQSDALGAAGAKLSGEWPGWEWMKDALKQNAPKAK